MVSWFKIIKVDFDVNEEVQNRMRQNFACSKKAQEWYVHYWRNLPSDGRGWSMFIPPDEADSHADEISGLFALDFIKYLYERRREIERKGNWNKSFGPHEIHQAIEIYEECRKRE